MADLLEALKEMAGEKGELVRRAQLAPRERRYRVVSVDDHFIEPADAFEGRMPARFVDRRPRVERDGEGVDWWIFEDERVPLMGADAIKGWEPGKGYLGPVNFDEMHPGVWNIHDRVKQMDVNGVLASLNFPSAAFGFAGTRFVKMKDRELGLASMRAFNEWILEGWAGPYPDRIIASQVAWLHDPAIAAGEIERNAARGFKAVSFSENPEKLGLPSMHSEHWDPFLAACEETETVVNLHVGSSSQTFVPSTDSPPHVLGALFPVNAMAAAADWIYAKIPVRFPMLIDRFDYMYRDEDPRPQFGGSTPSELLLRNFWFTTFSDPTTLALRDTIGVENILFETDYPHTDSSWPETQDLLADQMADLPADEVEAITWRNAIGLYRHVLKPDVGR
jgi:predicted TIM-barrel fold metal-dependent hydrolase